MPELICPDDPDLLPLVTGEPARQEVRAHLDTCELCRGRLRRLQAEVSDLRGALPPPGSSGGTLETTVGPEIAAPTADATPRQIGKYVVVRPLDSGGQGSVFQALHPTLGHLVVIKLAQHRAAEAAHDRLLTEGQVLARLEHPHLARIHDLDFHDGRPFLVMEYLPGRNLERQAEQERPTSRQAAAWVARLARAVDCAHRRGVLHLDIKPRNVVLDAASEPRLLDFGMARIVDGYSDGGPAAGGTPSYMPPEQARKSDRLDGRADVFGLGGVLYHLLVGHAPITGSSHADVLLKAERGEVDFDGLNAAAAPRRLKAICQRALSADPAKRHASAAELADDLERFLRRRPWWLALVGLLVLAAAFAFWRGRGPDTAAAGQSLTLTVRRHGFDFPRLGAALPLRNEDAVCVVGEVPADCQVGLFWLDSEGKVSRLGPLGREAASGRVQVRYPDRGSAPVQGPPGTELVLLCAAEEVPDPAVVEALLRPLVPLPELPADVWLVLDEEGVRARTKDERGLGSPRQERPAETFASRLEEVRRQLRERFSIVRGLVLPHR